MGSNSSQADSAGSIPVTRSTRPICETCCDTYELGAISHLKRRPSASEFSTRAMTACHYPCGRDCQLIGVSGPDTLSYGLARRGRHDRETVGHESAGTSRPRPIASAMAPVGTSRSVAVRPSARPTTPEGVTSGRSVPAGSPRRLNSPAIGEGESEHCRAPPRMHLGALGDLRLPQSPGSCFQRSVAVRRAPDAGNVRGFQRSRGTRGQGTVSHREFWNE